MAGLQAAAEQELRVARKRCEETCGPSADILNFTDAVMWAQAVGEHYRYALM